MIYLIIWKQQNVSILKIHHYRSLPLPFWPAQHMQGRTIHHQPQHLHINLPLPQLINLPQPLHINLLLPLPINQLPLLHTTQVSVDFWSTWLAISRKSKLKSISIYCKFYQISQQTGDWSCDEKCCECKTILRVYIPYIILFLYFSSCPRLPWTRPCLQTRTSSCLQTRTCPCLQTRTRTCLQTRTCLSWTRIPCCARQIRLRIQCQRWIQCY